MKALGSLLLGIAWLAGVVLAKGFWSTWGATCFPPYAFYVVVERVMVYLGWAS